MSVFFKLVTLDAYIASILVFQQSFISVIKNFNLICTIILVINFNSSYSSICVYRGT